MKYVVTLTYDGAVFYLRGTIWTRERERAQVYNSREDAHQAPTESQEIHENIAMEKGGNRGKER